MLCYVTCSGIKFEKSRQHYPACSDDLRNAADNAEMRQTKDRERRLTLGEASSPAVESVSFLMMTTEITSQAISYDV